MRCGWRDLPLAAVILTTALCFLPTLNQGFYYDDPLQLADAQRVLAEPSFAFGPGSFGRFRPLRLLTLAGLVAVFGVTWPLPFHASVLLLHLINVVLMNRLLARALATVELPGGETTRRACIGVGTMMFAVHWAGSEAVTYLSALGMVLVTMGMLIACLALLPREQTPGDGEGQWRRGMALVGGLLISIGGGEYWVALIPTMLCFAAWPGVNRTLRYRSAAGAAGGLAFVLVLYVWFQQRMIVADPAGQMQLDLEILLRQHAVLISRLFFPGGLIDESWGHWLLLGLVGASCLIQQSRAFLLSRPMLLLLLAWWSTAAAFSFNGLVHGGRFAYPGSGLAWAWAGGLLAMVAGRIGASHPQRGRRLYVSAVAVVLGLNLLYLHKRVAGVEPRAASLRALVDTVEQTKNRQPDRPIEVYFLDPDVEHAGEYLVLLGLLSRDQIQRGPAPLMSQGADQALETWSTGPIHVLVHHDLTQGYTFILHPGPDTR